MKRKNNDHGTEDLTVLKINKMTLMRPPMSNSKMTVRDDCAVSTCSPFLQPIKAHAHWLSPEERWPLDRSPPSLLVALIQNKANFPSTSLPTLLTFEWQAAIPYFPLQSYMYSFIYSFIHVRNAYRISALYLVTIPGDEIHLWKENRQN